MTSKKDLRNWVAARDTRISDLEAVKERLERSLAIAGQENHELTEKLGVAGAVGFATVNELERVNEELDNSRLLWRRLGVMLSEGWDYGPTNTFDVVNGKLHRLVEAEGVIEKAQFALQQAIGHNRADKEANQGGAYANILKAAKAAADKFRGDT